MAIHNDIGNIGENLAVVHLKKRGYTILEQNWRYKKDEGDIIAMKDNVLVIVEVKTRSSELYEAPQDAVTKGKQKRMTTLANAYIETKNLHNEVRFDIISVINPGKSAIINHIEDAFGILG